jgi:hypothetical protein
VLLAPPESAPRRIRHTFERRWSDIEERVAAAWAGVRAEVAARRPHTLILSGEYLFARMSAERADAFRSVVTEVADDVSIVAYVRQPSARYLSGVQQQLKLSGRFRPPAPLAVRPQIEAWSAAFPGAVTVAAFDRDTMVGHDIVTDFLSRALPGAELRLERTATRNESISAESMAILQDLHRRWYPNLDNRPAPGKRALVRQLMALDRDDPTAARPRLHAEVADYIDRSSVDLLWLRDTYGVRFAGLDYDRFDPGLAPPRAQDVSDICTVDAARKARLTRRALNPLTRAWWYRLGSVFDRKRARLGPLDKERPGAGRTVARTRGEWEGRLVQASVARCLRTPPRPATALDLGFGLATAYAATATGARLSLATVLFGPITVVPHRAAKRPFNARRSCFAPAYRPTRDLWWRRGSTALPVRNAYSVVRLPP